MEVITRLKDSHKAIIGGFLLGLLLSTPMIIDMIKIYLILNNK